MHQEDRKNAQCALETRVVEALAEQISRQNLRDRPLMVRVIEPQAAGAKDGIGFTDVSVPAVREEIEMDAADCRQGRQLLVWRQSSRAGSAR